MSDISKTALEKKTDFHEDFIMSYKTTPADLKSQFTTCDVYFKVLNIFFRNYENFSKLTTATS